VIDTQRVCSDSDSEPRRVAPTLLFFPQLADMLCYNGNLFKSIDFLIFTRAFMIVDIWNDSHFSVQLTVRRSEVHHKLHWEHMIRACQLEDRMYVLIQ
jgi:hypothetical protein